mgnify:FL=1
MHAISENDIIRRIQRDNPWWKDDKFEFRESAWPRRVYFDAFKELALNFSVRRAAILLGPRRVGKTFLIKQLISEAVAEGFDPKKILYASIDTPVYSGVSLEKFLSLFESDEREGQKIVIFDEIQYLAGWELHLKDLVDNYPEVKFIVTGSAAAALRLKSQESGAGRFSEFILPPLTFAEFIRFVGKEDELLRPPKDNSSRGFFTTTAIEELNQHFIQYLNYGGYPEAVLNKDIRDNADQFIRNDIIDKVLLKDLPSLYGINEIQELNRLFSFLAYNSGNEASLEKISKGSGLAKPTIRKYIEYLESAFLIMKLSHVDENCRSLQRERNFKIYLTNPSMRSALFAPVDTTDNDGIGRLAESAIFSQWQHGNGIKDLRYARWKNEGEVDIVYMSAAEQRPIWIVEIKWSDRISDHFGEVTKNLHHVVERHKTVENAVITTKTISAESKLNDTPLEIVPSSLYCYTVGRNATTRLRDRKLVKRPA